MSHNHRMKGIMGAPANNPQQPPSAGAIDLGSIRGDKAKQLAVAHGILEQNGFLCLCGERIRDEGVFVIGYNLGQFPEIQMTPQGPMQVLADSAQFVGANFCSKRCTSYLDALKNGVPVAQEGIIRPRVVATRALPPIEWTDEQKSQEACGKRVP